MSQNILACHQHWSSLLNPRNYVFPTRMLVWDTLYPLHKENKSHSTSGTDSDKFRGQCVAHGMAFPRRTSWKTKLSRFQKYLQKVRQGCAEKLDDASSHANKLLWGKFRLELCWDYYLYTSFLLHHKYHLFCCVYLRAGIVVQLVLYSSTLFLVLTDLFIFLNHIILQRQLLK